MKTAIAFVILGLSILAAGPAYAIDPDVAYQNSLLGRALHPDDKAFCESKTSDASEFKKCHVTRNFLVDINNGRDQAFPPMADLRYTRDKAEREKIADKL